MATFVGLTEIWMIPFDCPTPKKPQIGTNILHLSLTVSELLLFKLKCKFSHFGAKGGKFQFFKPNHTRNVNATERVDYRSNWQTCSQEHVTEKNKTKNRRLTMTIISRTRKHTRFVPTDPSICVWGHRRNQLRIFWKSVQGLRSWKTLKNAISYWNRSSSYRADCDVSMNESGMMLMFFV